MTAVSVHPAIHFGRPCIAGRPVDTIAEMVWVGESVATVAAEYDLARADVLIACWYQARYGDTTVRRPWRKRWSAWADSVEADLWHGRHDCVPDPPTRGDTPMTTTWTNPYPEPDDGSIVMWDEDGVGRWFEQRIDASANPDDAEERWFDADYLAGSDPVSWDALVRSMGDAVPVRLVPRPIEPRKP